MLQTREYGATFFSFGIEIGLDLDDRRNRITRLAEKLEADGARGFGHLVQYPARGGYEAVAAFFLHAGQSGEKFVGDILAQTFFAKLAAINFQYLGLEGDFLLRCASAFSRVRPLESESCQRNVVNLAEIVIQTRDFEPVTIWIHHAPTRKIVERSTP